MAKRPRVFCGWWTAIAGLAISTVAIGTPYYAFSVFLKPTATEFGWDRATVALSQVFFFIPYGIISLFVGKLTPRFGARWVLTLGVLGLGASLFLLSSISTLWQL